MKNILLIEDSSADTLLIRESFEEGQVDAELNTVPDGVEALHFLQKKEKYKNVATPDFILLDLNLPKLSGFELLKKIKADATIKNIPIIVLTCSAEPKDRLMAKSLGVDLYLVKPNDYDGLVESVFQIKDFITR